MLCLQKKLFFFYNYTTETEKMLSTHSSGKIEKKESIRNVITNAASSFRLIKGDYCRRCRCNFYESRNKAEKAQRGGAA